MPPTNPITVVIADFDDLLLAGLRALIDADESIETLASGVAASRLAVVVGAHRADVAVLDAGSPGKLSEVQQLAASHPTTSLVVLAHEPSAAECAQMLAFGASACLGTDTQGRDVLNAIHLASRGLRLTPQGLADPQRRASGDLLTQREAEVLPMLRAGRSNAQIALALGVGIETVRTHSRNIYRKLGVSSRRELLAPLPVEFNDAAATRLPPPRRRTPRPASRSRGHA